MFAYRNYRIFSFGMTPPAHEDILKAVVVVFLGVSQQSANKKFTLLLNMVDYTLVCSVVAKPPPVLMQLSFSCSNLTHC